MSRSPEYLVSFCLTQEGDVAKELDAISALSRACDEKLQYWEIVYVAAEFDRPAISAAADKFAPIKCLRIVLVRDGINYYRRRKIAAYEAIGDVVVLTSFNEMDRADLVSFAEEAMARNRIVIGRRPKRLGLQSISYSIIGLISRHRADGRDLKTMALPRDQLIAILNRSSAPIDLRFEPKRGVASYLRKELPLIDAGGEAGLLQRLELLSEIIATSAPRFLAMFAIASAVVSAFATIYGIYAVAVLLFRNDVAPGWFSTAIALSGSSAFLSLGLGVIALGIANVVDPDRRAGHEIVDEIGNISFYDRIHELNVETDLQLHKADKDDPRV